MYLLLSGYLPFSGKSEQDTISQTLKAEVKFNQPSWKSISQDARILVARLLRNDPSQRPSGEKIISHPWFDEIRSEMEREAKKEMENRGNLALRLSSSLSVGGVSESNSGEFQPSNPKQEISSNSPKKLPDLSSAASSDNSPENSEIKQ
jgi:serine/threonine protein kinase